MLEVITAQSPGASPTSAPSAAPACARGEAPGRYVNHPGPVPAASAPWRHARPIRRRPIDNASWRFGALGPAGLAWKVYFCGALLVHYKKTGLPLP